MGFEYGAPDVACAFAVIVGCLSLATIVEGLYSVVCVDGAVVDVMLAHAVGDVCNGSLSAANVTVDVSARVVEAVDVSESQSSYPRMLLMISYRGCLPPLSCRGYLP